MPLPNNISFAIAAWCIAAGCALAAARISRRSQSIPDLLAVSWLSGCVGFAVIGYCVRDSSGINGSEWFYLSWSVPIGAFAFRLYAFLDKRSEQILIYVMERLGVKDDRNDPPCVDDSGDDHSFDDRTDDSDPVENESR